MPDVPCFPGMPITCVPAGADAAAGAATDALGNGFAEAMRGGAQWVVKTTIGWWIKVPAVDLEASPVPRIRGYVLWLAIAVAVAGVIWQGMLLALSRRPEPMFAVGRGLFLVALWTAIGIAGPAAALDMGDAFSTWVLDAAAGTQATDRLVALAGLSKVTAPGAVIVLGLLMMLAGLAQAVLMMFREASIIVLAGVVVLAAAGSMTNGTRPWLPRVTGWMLALICYKPAAALVYAAALTLVGEGSDPRTVLVGLAMMVLSIAALPALMKLFTWTAGAASSGGGGLAALAGASAAAIHASASLGGGAHRQSAQAASISADLGTIGTGGTSSNRGSGGAPSGPAPDGGPPRPSFPSNAASPVPPPGGAASTTAGAAAATGARAAAGPVGLGAQAAASAASAAHRSAVRAASTPTGEERG